MVGSLPQLVAALDACGRGVHESVADLGVAVQLVLRARRLELFLQGVNSLRDARGGGVQVVSDSKSSTP